MDTYDFTDQNGQISISRLIDRLRHKPNDPRRISPEMADRLVQLRIEQMKAEVEEGLRRLEDIERLRR